MEQNPKTRDSILSSSATNAQQAAAVDTGSIARASDVLVGQEAGADAQEAGSNVSSPDAVTAASPTTTVGFSPVSRLTTTAINQAKEFMRHKREMQLHLYTQGDEAVTHLGVSTPEVMLMRTGAPERFMQTGIKMPRPIYTAEGVQFSTRNFSVETGDRLKEGQKPLFINLTESKPHAAAVSRIDTQLLGVQDAHRTAVRGGSGGNIAFVHGSQEPDGWLGPARDVGAIAGGGDALPRVIIEFEDHNRSMPEVKRLAAEYFQTPVVQLVVVIKVFPVAGQRNLRAAALVYQRQVAPAVDIDLVVALDFGTLPLRPFDKTVHFNPAVPGLAGGPPLPAVPAGAWHRITPTLNTSPGGAVRGLNWPAPAAGAAALPGMVAGASPTIQLPAAAVFFNGADDDGTPIGAGHAGFLNHQLDLGAMVDDCVMRLWE
jgi:hypothetical protein